MGDGQSKGRRPEQIDLPVLWVLVRGTQVLLAAFFAKAVYLSFNTDSFALDLFSAVSMLLVIWAFFRRVVTGTGDSSGIHYRRYFRLKTATWADIEEIQWVGYRLRVLIRGKRKRVLVFLLNPLKSVGAYWAHRLGAEVAPPEILERIRSLPIEAPPQMASAPPHSRWVLRVFLGVGVLFLLVFLYRLLSASFFH